MTNSFATTTSGWWTMASLLVLSVIFLLLGGMAGDHQTTTTSWSNHNKRRLETSCSGICAVGFDVEFPTIVIVSGKTCQDLNDSKLHLMEGSEGCKKAKRLSSRCGCVPSATTTTTTENEESDNTTTTVWSVQINNTSSTNNSRNNNGNKKAPYVNRFTEKQQAALKTTPHITGMLSLLGSIFVIQDIVRDPEKLKRTYSRLVLGVSIFDTFASVGFFLGTWAPDGGSTGFCSFQGFLIQLGVAVPIYNACLSIYYLLVLKFQWSERKIRAIEKYLHCLPTLFGSVTSILGAILTLYNSTGLFCHIASVPFYCWKMGIPCDRGEHSNILVWVFYYGPIWACILVATISMTMVSMHVMNEEKVSRKWRNPSGNNHHKDKMKQLSSQVFWQSVLYVSVFYLTWLFSTIIRILQSKRLLVAQNNQRNFWLLFFASLFMPLQGFFNFFIYFYPRYARKRAIDDTAWWQSVRTTIFHRLSNITIDLMDKLAHSFRTTSRRSDPTRRSEPESNEPEVPSEESEQSEELIDADVMDPTYVLSSYFTTISTKKEGSEHEGSVEN